MFNKTKKKYSILMATIIIAASSLINVGVANAATLSDVDSSSDYAKEAIIELAEKDIIKGDEDGNFNPQNTVTRAEMIAMIVRALEVDTTDVPDIATFQDAPTTHWAYKYVEAAYREGIINGMSKEVFGTDEQCTREQMTVMFIRSLGISEVISNENNEFTLINKLSDKDEVSSWAKDAVEFSLASEIMKGTGSNTFAPLESAQRQQAAVLTQRVLNNKENIIEYANGNIETAK